MILFLYVDDVGIDDFIDCMKSHGFKLTKDDVFSEYLGIKFNHNLQDNTITMTQPGLIKKILFQI